MRGVWLARWSRHRAQGRAEVVASNHDLRSVSALLKDATQACATAPTIDDATRQCLEIVARFTGWPIAHAYRRRGEDDALMSMKTWYVAPCADRDAAQAFIAASEQLVFTSGTDLIGQVAAAGRPLTCEDVISRPDFIRAAAARASSVQGCFALPVLVAGQVEIVLEFFAHQVTACDADLLELTAFVAERLGAMIVERGRSTSVLDAALAHMSHGLVMVDGDDRVVLVNPKYLEFYGLSAEALQPGTPMREVIERSVAAGNYPDSGVDEIWEVRRRMMAEGAATHYRHALPGGRVIDVHIDPLADGNGWVSIHTDVTGQATAEKVLSEQHRLFETALSNMAQGLLMLDADLRLIVCNERYRTMFDLPAEVARPGAHLSEIIGHDLTRRTPGTTVEALMAERRALLKGGEPLTLQSTLGDGRIVEMVYNPMAAGGWVVTYSDVTARRQAEAHVAHVASHDALTDLPNRTLFRERLIMSLAEAGDTDPTTTAVLCLDLDRFKSINDTLGHSAGDTLLREVARRLCAVVGETNVVARLGGDEFAVLLSRVRPEVVGRLAKRLIEEIGQAYEIDGQRANVGLSVGIALAPTDGRDPEQLLRAADMALYRAKEEGRGTLCFFEQEMNARMQARRALELDLRQAQIDGQFELYYQPLVTLDTDRISGFEALVRWNHPIRGLVSPAAFIPLAEEVGLIVSLGAWVLREACREAATWPADVRVAVNLSPVQFSGPDLVPTVMAALGDAELDPRRLELEITEGVLLQEGEATLSTLHRLKALGVRIAMDDFGTGYSSLSYLQRFPFDKIKIDRSFVTDLASRADAVAIVRAVTSLGASLSIETTAEGIETPEQLERLRLEGCTQVQGYLISRPKPACEVPKMLARNGDDRTLTLAAKVSQAA